MEERPITDSVGKTEWMTCFCVINFDLEYGQKLEYMYPLVDFVDKEISNLCFLSFPETSGDVGDTIYTFRLRRSTQSKKNKKDQFLFGFVFFRQEKDPSISRGYLQKSVVLISSHPFISLYKKVVGITGPNFFEKGEIVLEGAFNQISVWPPNPKNKSLDLPFLGHILNFTPPTFNLRSIKNTSPGSPVDSSPNNQHVSLYTTFAPIITKLWTLWELVLLCEPILIISCSPQLSSDAVLALVSLIYPLNYSGDFRPYFTIHDPDYTMFSDILRESGTDEPEKNHEKVNHMENHGYILGVTNPIFRKEFNHWPHVILLGDESKKKTIVGKDRTFRKTGTKAPINALVSKYKPLRTIDDEVSKQLIKKNPGSTGTSAVNNELVRRCMDDVTAHFMTPLQEYYPKSYFPDKKEYHPFKNPPTMAPFKEADFLKYLLKMGTKTKDIELYRRFIRTPNFVTWFRAKKRAAEQEIIRNYVSSLDPIGANRILKGKSIVEIVDVWLRSQERKSVLIKKGEMTPEMVVRYDTFLEAVLSHLPEEVRQNVHLARNKTSKNKTEEIKSTNHNNVDHLLELDPLSPRKYSEEEIPKDSEVVKDMSLPEDTNNKIIV